MKITTISGFIKKCLFKIKPLSPCASFNPRPLRERVGDVCEKSEHYSGGVRGILPRISIFIMSLFIISCSGTFATDKTLEKIYSLKSSDSNMTIYAEPRGESIITAAVKNTGSAFMTDLSVMFQCRDSKLNYTKIFYLGNLKPYFMKELNLPVSFEKCSELVFNYRFIPSSGAGAMSDSFIDRGFHHIEPNPVEGEIILPDGSYNK